MRTFTKLRERIASHKDLTRKLNDLEKKYDSRFQIVFEAIRQILEVEEKPKKKMGISVRKRRYAERSGSVSKDLTPVTFSVDIPINRQTRGDL